MKIRISHALVAGMALSAACTAQHYLHGATVVRAGTTSDGALATWNVGPCTDTQGQAAGSPAVRYHLMQGATGFELYERVSDGSGSRVTNRWQDEQGWHFYQWVRNTGWEIVISEPGQPGVRNVFTDARTVEGRPTGPIVATCPLTPATEP